jgi:hypothetical protein
MMKMQDSELRVIRTRFDAGTSVIGFQFPVILCHAVFNGYDR